MVSVCFIIIILNSALLASRRNGNNHFIDTSWMPVIISRAHLTRQALSTSLLSFDISFVSFVLESTFFTTLTSCASHISFTSYIVFPFSQREVLLIYAHFIVKVCQYLSLSLAFFNISFNLFLIITHISMILNFSKMHHAFGVY